MADASPETIERLIGNSEKGLKDIEMSLPLILETRQAVLDAIEKQKESNVVLELMLVVFDTLLAENEVIYDLSASLDALLKAKNDYTKRYYMQSLNLCFVEACSLFAGDENDENSLLTRLEKLTKQLNQAGCQFIARHIIDDIQAFRKDYCDRELRNITRHYDDPIKMYEKQQGLNNIDFFAKGASQLMAIRMEVTVLSSFLLRLFAPVNKQEQNVASKKTCGFDIKGIINDAIFKAFKKNNLEEKIQRMLNKGQSTIDDCYRLYNQCQAAIRFLEEKNCMTDDFKKMELLLKLRMETLFLQYDVACSVWGFLNASSDKERSQNLRLIHITKQAALTHIYGYNENVREKSLWTEIKVIEETRSENLNTSFVEKLLEELTGNLTEDKECSQMFAHYRYKNDYYIPARLELFGNMVHHKELMDAMKLLQVCKALVGYTTGLLFCMDEKQKQERKIRHDEWMGKLDELVARSGNDERMRESLNSMQELIDQIYGDAKVN